MTIGIYILKFHGTDKVYVGQSLRIEERFNKHKLKLNNGLANYKLMDAYSKYGYPILEVIVETDIDEDLDTLENEAIEIYDAVNNGFNINSKAGGGGIGLQGEAHGNSRYTNSDILKVFKFLIEDISFKDILSNIPIAFKTVEKEVNGKVVKKQVPTDFATMNEVFKRELKLMSNTQSIATGVSSEIILKKLEYNYNQYDMTR